MSQGRSGLLVLDKPGGMTSHDVVDRVRRALGESRVGHGGTLDPIATGVLPVALGRATRLVRFLPGDPKVYRVTARLGVETTTGDVAGEPLAPARSVALEPAALEAALDAFRGPIEQVPPMYSAKKVAGERLYRAARRGEQVPRAKVRIVIHALVLLGCGPDTCELEVSCSPGTYVRSLVTDLGRALGVGATVQALRRIRSGAFTADQALSLDALADAGRVAERLVPLEHIPITLESVAIDAPAEAGFRHGRSVPFAGPVTGPVAVRSSDGRLLGIAQSVAGDPHLRPCVVLAPDEP